MLNASSGNIVLYIPLALLVSSIWGLDGLRKIHDPAAYQKEVKGSQLKGKSKVVDILKMVGIAVVVLGAFVLFSYFKLSTQ